MSETPTSAPDAALEVPYSAIEDAAGRLDGVVHRTPMLSSRTAADWVRSGAGVRLAGDRLYLKAEHMQKTGSFKARGMTNRIATLSADARARGAITLSAGNAGQAYAWAGAAAGVPVTVVMPEGAVRSKVEACLGYGARVILHGTHVGDTFAEMERIRDAEGLTFVHPFDDPNVIAGNGTAGLELVDDVPDVDVVVVGVGGGGLISGVATAVKSRRPSARVVGVEPEASNAMSLALERDAIVTIQPRSVADGLGAPFAGRWTMAIARRLLDGIILLDDPTILAGLRFALERLKQVLEPAGAAALAAVLAGRVPLEDGERVAVVLSGGNVEVDRLGELLGPGRDAGAPRLVHAEVVQPVVVDAEVVGELVDDRDPDLVGEVVRVGEVGLQRQPEQRDPVGLADPVRPPLGAGDALVQPVQRVVGLEPVLAALLRGRLVVDDDRDLLERRGERHRDGRQRSRHEVLEPPMPGGRSPAAGGRGAGAASALGHGARILGPMELPPADVPEPDMSLEPAGYIVTGEDGDRIHFLDWGGPAEVDPSTTPGVVAVPGLACDGVGVGTGRQAHRRSARSVPRRRDGPARPRPLRRTDR